MNVSNNAGFNPFAGWSEPEESSCVKKEVEMSNTIEMKIEINETHA